VTVRRQSRARHADRGAGHQPDRNVAGRIERPQVGVEVHPSVPVKTVAEFIAYV